MPRGSSTALTTAVGGVTTAIATPPTNACPSDLRQYRVRRRCAHGCGDVNLLQSATTSNARGSQQSCNTCLRCGTSTTSTGDRMAAVLYKLGFSGGTGSEQRPTSQLLSSMAAAREWTGASPQRSRKKPPERSRCSKYACGIQGGRVSICNLGWLWWGSRHPAVWCDVAFQKGAGRSLGSRQRADDSGIVPEHNSHTGTCICAQKNRTGAAVSKQAG